MARIFGIEFVDILNVPMDRRLQTLAVFQWTLTFLYLGLFCLAITIMLFFSPLQLFILAYIVWYVLDWKTPECGGRRSKWVRSWKVWNYFRDYFPVKLHKTAELDPSRNYLLIYHPHGIMAHGAFINFATEATGFADLFPGIRSTLLSLRYQFLFPLNREYSMALGVCSCSKESMTWLFTRQGVGNAVTLVVGGAHEALEARPGSLILTLAQRKGFARLAMEHGIPLVPVFSFGETEIYNQVSNPAGSLLRRFQTMMMKVLSFSPPLFHGRGIFNYTFGIQPYRKPINTVVGCPMEVEKVSDPTNEQVDALHKKYIECLTDLFETHKTKYGIADTEHLKIV